jgi:hypothetical protein
VKEKLKSAELAAGGKCGKPPGPGVGRRARPTTVPFTVPVPLPLNWRMPSTANDWA